METKQIKVRITFTEQLLATASGNPELHREFIASKAPGHEQAEEEMAALPAEAQVEKASTIFHRNPPSGATTHDPLAPAGALFVFDYHWRGYLKEGIGTLCELGEFTKLSKWTYKRAVDSAVFVAPRRIYLARDGKILDKPDGTLQRPLRATTMQGDRVALANSEFVHPGTQCEFTIRVLESSNAKSAWKELTLDVVKAVLTMGQDKGTGQWRGGGYGRFTWEEVK